MPVLDLGDVSDPKDRYEALVKIYALMAWPDKPTSRDRFVIASLVQHFIGTNPIPKHVYELKKYWQAFESAGGWREVYDALDGEKYRLAIDKLIPRWHCVGAQIRTLCSVEVHHKDIVESGASLDKVRTAISSQPEEFLIDPKTNLKKAWESFKGVSTWCGAFYEVTANVLRYIRSGRIPESAFRQACDIFIQQNLPLFLVWAQNYYEFGVAFKPRHSGKPLLDSTRTWRIIVNNQLPEVSFQPIPLDQKFINAVIDHTAPTLRKTDL